MDRYSAFGQIVTGVSVLARLAVIAACLGASAVSATAKEFPSFSFEDVDFRPGCAPNAAFERLMALLQPRLRTGADDAERSFDEPLYNAVSGAALHELQLNREVPWHGLRLVAVRSYHGIESGPSNFSLVFADSPERVREVWNVRGWNLPPVGETRVMEGEVIATEVGVEAEGQRVAVTCFVD